MNVNAEKEWELFVDYCYYGMYAVRPVNDRNFESPRLFHFEKEEDAEKFLSLVKMAQ